MNRVNRSIHDLGKAIADALPSGHGFVLLVAELATTATAYVSNIDRPDAIRALRELADRLEGN